MPLLQGNLDLTSKEWAITALVSQGHTNAEIAAQTQTGEQLIEAHLRKIFAKTGCWNRTEVALWYLKLGVENERRFRDRREADLEITNERRMAGRRHPLQPSSRANEQREVNLDE